MPRRARPTSRPKLPDRKFGSTVVQEFTNKLMQDGKKAKAQGIIYDAMARAETSTRKPGLEVFETALKNATPLIEVKPRRVGGATYQVPVEVRPRRAGTLAIRWIVGYSRQRREKTMAERLANELLDASNGLGASVKRREDMHKMADSNKAFAHYRW